MEIDNHIKYDESVTRLALGSYATTDASDCRFVKIVGNGWGGCRKYKGPITDVPWVSLIQEPLVLAADGDGMADFRNVPNLSDGDMVFVERYGWHRIERYRGVTMKADPNGSFARMVPMSEPG